MPKARPNRLERVAVGVAVLRRERESPWLRSRMAQPKRIAVLMLGMSLSIGGVSEAMQGVHFFVERDPGQREDRSGAGPGHPSRGHDAGVVRLEFVIQTLPDSPGSIRFTQGETLRYGLAEGREECHRKIHRELTIINDSIREQFFSTSMPFGDLIHEKAAKYDVNPALVAAVIEQESKFHSSARSQRGARGLMQLMPKTGRWMGARDLVPS